LPESTETYSECGGKMKLLGEDVAEQLEDVPASFRVSRHVRPKLACVCCDYIAQAAAPNRTIERGLAGQGSTASIRRPICVTCLPASRSIRSTVLMNYCCGT